MTDKIKTENREQFLLQLAEALRESGVIPLPLIGDGINEPDLHGFSPGERLNWRFGIVLGDWPANYASRIRLDAENMIIDDNIAPRIDFIPGMIRTLRSRVETLDGVAKDQEPQK